MAQKRRTRRTSRSRKKDHSFLKMLAATMLALAVVGAGYLGAGKKIDGSELIDKLFSSKSTAVATTAGDTEKFQTVTAPASLPQEMVHYKGFTVSFNPELHIPNYTVYELTKAEVDGDQARAKSFDCDESVKGCPQPSDYTRSGYDRGHMTPAGDMKWDYTAMRQSFFMTNICPQRHALNGGGWKTLEEKVRDWASRDSALIVITGPITAPGMATIGNGVAVPPRFFKVLLAPYAVPARGIAFIYRNEGGQKRVADQAVSIDEVEAVTGFDFFSALPDKEENRIESANNYNEWNN